MTAFEFNLTSSWLFVVEDSEKTRRQLATVVSNETESLLKSRCDLTCQNTLRLIDSVRIAIQMFAYATVLVGVPLNLFMLIYLAIRRRPRLMWHYFVVLAVANLCFLLTLGINRLRQVAYPHSSLDWWCKLSMWLLFVSSALNTWTWFAVSLNRYLNLKSIVRHRAWAASRLMSVLWVLFLCVPIQTWIVVIFNAKVGQNGICRADINHYQIKWLNLAESMLAYFLPFILVLVINSCLLVNGVQPNNTNLGGCLYSMIPFWMRRRQSLSSTSTTGGGAGGSCGSRSNIQLIEVSFQETTIITDDDNEFRARTISILSATHSTSKKKVSCTCSGNSLGLKSNLKLNSTASKAAIAKVYSKLITSKEETIIKDNKRVDSTLNMTKSVKSITAVADSSTPSNAKTVVIATPSITSSTAAAVVCRCQRTRVGSDALLVIRSGTGSGLNYGRRRLKAFRRLIICALIHFTLNLPNQISRLYVSFNQRKPTDYGKSLNVLFGISFAVFYFQFLINTFYFLWFMYGRKHLCQYLLCRVRRSSER